uniref:Uncharacterized protein n=1 Tax=Chromera velia CCMP2878 TaxID=1169474 RepID=A0A0G4H1L8_9ALVE|eukprot:Cvel_796.t1-p1 / transcript=Cvel_796.t1 / gene=Cvel_796 / organism=Chromera_velia_CCMP2878 / gene_product=hypothetical protein / transcript_product=hypothetical protein / location=Cvel_scaffold25:5318-11058(-) / protein_length=951 / sequence_SO=supercontig / SO=protein_coding / is_pseudo=false
MSGSSPACASFLAIFTHANLTPEHFSGLVSSRDGFGSAVLLLQCINAGLIRFSLPRLDLSEFSLGARWLRLLLSSLPSSGTLEALTCGPHVCRGGRLHVLVRFLKDLRDRCGGTSAVCLKSLDLSQCELRDSEARSLLYSLPPSLETLNLSDNFLRRGSMETLSSALSSSSLLALREVDVSNNPLGPSGVSALSEGMGKVEDILSLQTLRLRNTHASLEGVRSLSEALKAMKSLRLEHLDLGENDMRAEGVKAFGSAVKAAAVPSLKSLRLDSNSAARNAQQEVDASGLSELFSSSNLSEVEELDLRNDSLGPNTAHVCSDAVAAGRLPKLRSLRCSEKSFFDAQNLASIANAISSGRTGPLQTLEVDCFDLEGGEVGGGETEASTALSVAVASCHQRLSELTELKWREKSGLFRSGSVRLAQCLAGGSVPLLESLVIQPWGGDTENDGIREGVNALANGLAEGKLLRLENLELDFFACVCPSAALSALGRAIAPDVLPNLQTLVLKWEGDEALVGLAGGLGSGCLTSLRVLSLCVAWEGGEGCRTFGRVLSTQSENFPSLELLKLEWEPDDALFGLCEGIYEGRLSPLVKVDLQLNGWGGAEFQAGASVSALSGVIRAGKIPGLQKLGFMSRLGISRENGRELGAALTHANVCLSSLKELFFDEPIFSGGQEAQGKGLGALMSALVEGPSTLPGLETIETRWNLDQPARICIDECGARAVATGITTRKFPSLERLILDCRDVGPVGVQAFCLALSSPEAVKFRSLSIELGFANVQVADGAEVGMFSLALASGHLSGLEELLVESNYDLGGVRALCAGLGSGKLSSLRSLDFSFFNLCLARVRELAEVLDGDRLPSLQDLNLCRSPHAFSRWGDEGLRALSNAWLQRKAPPLEKLNLKDNGLTDASAPSLMVLLGAGRLEFLLTVNLARNEFSSSVWNILTATFPCVRSSG